MNVPANLSWRTRTHTETQTASEEIRERDDDAKF